MKTNQQKMLQRSIFKIKLYRIEKSLSQSEFSELIGISNRKYQRIEAYESVPDLELLYRISDVLNVNFDHLFSPNLQQTTINGVHFFSDKNDFFMNSKVKEMGLENLITEDFLKTLFEMDRPKDVLQIEAFSNFVHPLTFGDYSINCFNKKSLEAFQQKFEISEYPTLKYNLKDLIMLWDMLYVDILRYGYFSYIIPADQDLKNIERTAFCQGMINHQGKIFLLTSFAENN